MRLKFYASYRVEWDDIALVVAQMNHDGRTTELGAEVQFSEYKPGNSTPPTLALRTEEATALMTALWEAGVRPRNVGTQGQAEATRAHLEDMRTIAFNKLGIKQNG